MPAALPKITPAMAAELIGSSTQYVRVRLQRNLFDPPIGSAMKIGTGRYYYDIRPQKLAEYLGITVSEMYSKLGMKVST